MPGGEHRAAGSEMTPLANADVATAKGKPPLSPTAIAPIATASEEQKENEDKENETHDFLQPCDDEFLLDIWCGIIFQHLRNLLSRARPASSISMVSPACTTCFSP
jgi:hypothetical protein